MPLGLSLPSHILCIWAGLTYLLTFYAFGPALPTFSHLRCPLELRTFLIATSLFIIAFIAAPTVYIDGIR